jgi:uncharacterized membrane protein
VARDERPLAETPADLRPTKARRDRDRFLVSRSDAKRLGVPLYPRRSLVRFEYDPEFFGRFSENFARFLGTARFLAYMTIFVAVWFLWNVLAPANLRFDPFPFIFLTLMLSLQASYAAPLILLAQNRQEARDRVQYDHDRDVASRTRADMEFLSREVASLRMAVGEMATRDFLRSELRSLLNELDERDTERADGQARRTGAPVRD